MGKINLEFRKEIIKAIPEILKCYQCGTCVSSCPTEKYGGSYSPRRKILSASYGEKKILATELWNCVTCNTCNERCPQEVNPYGVLVKLKNLAYRFGLIDESYAKTRNNVLETGRAIPVTAGTSRRRKDLGLKELRPIKLRRLIKK